MGESNRLMQNEKKGIRDKNKISGLKESKSDGVIHKEVMCQWLMPIILAT
jgi:hypothetical protein